MPALPSKKMLWLLLLVAAAIAIRLFSANAERVEKWYATGIYPLISKLLKMLFGWLPFSLGDLLYLFLIAWLLYRMARAIKKLVKRQVKRDQLLRRLYQLTVTYLLLYIGFNLLWGINYNRLGINYQLGINPEKYSREELITVDSLLLEKVNSSKQALLRKGIRQYSPRQYFTAANEAYQQLTATYPFLNAAPASVKASFWGWAGSYIGFTGYYNPFTGEAQVNTQVPSFLQPYTTCHEMAHQLGYAKENEANFVGYLAAAASRDTMLHYSVYLDLFLYTQRNLFDTDSARVRAYSRQLIPAVKADLKEWQAFNNAHRSVMEPVFKWLYGKYLQQNQQPSGIMSYDEVSGFLVAYYRKFGKL